MTKLVKALNSNKLIRVIGIDDAPFSQEKNSEVNIVGTICSGTRIEGLLCGSATKDGIDATDNIISMIKNSKFISQLHVVILDGIAIGGFNIIDLKLLSDTLDLPCVAVMRKYPDLNKIDKALRYFEDYQKRKEMMNNAGKIFDQQGFVFQVVGESPENIGLTLNKITDNGKVPEALRMSHLIGSAIKTGQSSKRA